MAVKQLLFFPPSLEDVSSNMLKIFVLIGYSIDKLKRRMAKEREKGTEQRKMNK